MKVIKPMPLSLITRCFEFRGRIKLGISALLMVPLGGTARKLWLEKDLWAFWAAQPEAAWPLEEGIPRVRSEYLVSGRVFNPNPGHGACALRAQVGAQRKDLVVHGMRHWEGDRMSAPAPFASLPLGWSQTWGGPRWPENPLGMGMDAVQTADGPVRALPHIEYPHAAVHVPDAQGRPAGLGPIDGMWPQRAALRGTYDQQWLVEHFPAIAPDADWACFNSAPADQQRDEPFSPDEAYAFHHLHPEQAVLQGRLPGLRARAFATTRRDSGERFREIALRLNTLWFFPEAERAVLVFQGMGAIAEDDGADVLHLMGAIEDVGSPRSADHYLAVRDKRLNREHGALESLREEDLMPADLVVPMFDLTPVENRALDRGQRRARAEREAARALVASYGLDPDVHAPPVDGPALPEIRTLDDLIGLRKEMQDRHAAAVKKGEVDKAKAVADVKQVFEAQQMDFGLIEREMAGLETTGPPRPFADGLVRDFQGFIKAGKAHGGDVRELEEMLADERLMAHWRDADSKQLVAYRGMAHQQIPASRRTGAAGDPVRHRVAQQVASRGSLAGWDLSGADLHGMDLTGANLRGALMENANLTGALLTGADLSDAVLAHATLQATQAVGAIFDRANLGAAVIERSDFSRASLRNTILQRAQVRETAMCGAVLDGIRLEDATLLAVDFSGAHSKVMLSFFQRDLRHCRFAGVHFAQCLFVECRLDAVDFTGAHLAKCAFVTVQATGAVLCGLRIESGCFAQQCVLDGCDLSRAVLPNLGFRGTSMVGARLAGAMLDGCDFSECDLRGADLGRASLRGARLVRAGLQEASLAGANLMDAVLQHARLDLTDFSRANLYRADLARVRLARHGPGFDTALTTHMRTYPRHRPQAAEAS
ncbi:MAG: DUF2169 domain-containing protein [Variovorax sp.]|nr:MAG: DUF2169 domain-containing protein [Variovorax sp.]